MKKRKYSVPTWGISQKSSGKVSPIGDCSPEMLASFPLLGNVPKKFWRAFPYWGLSQKSSSEFSPIGESSKTFPVGFPQ